MSYKEYKPKHRQVEMSWEEMRLVLERWTTEDIKNSWNALVRENKLLKQQMVAKDKTILELQDQLFNFEDLIKEIADENHYQRD